MQAPVTGVRLVCRGVSSWKKDGATALYLIIVVEVLTAARHGEKAASREVKGKKGLKFSWRGLGRIK
jgi:hypothetical protein